VEARQAGGVGRQEARNGLIAFSGPRRGKPARVASELKDELGAGSLTALPIIETQAGDVSAYIPTNVISITDGQIFLETDLFYSGVRPAINVGLSVSRVGGKAQTKAMRKIAGRLRLDLAQYRELAAFAQFGSDLDKATQDVLARGARLTELLKQQQYEPLPVAKQVMQIYAGTDKSDANKRGWLREIPVTDVQRWAKEFTEFAETRYPGIQKSIEEKRELTADIKTELNKAITEFNGGFKATPGAKI
jgi:F-type H+-transporting ATPase subunit alpha